MHPREGSDNSARLTRAETSSLGAQTDRRTLLCCASRKGKDVQNLPPYSNQQGLHNPETDTVWSPTCFCSPRWDLLCLEQR